MWIKRLTSVLIALTGCVGAAAHAANCPQMLRSVHRPAPEYPSPEQAEPYLRGTSYLHVFVEGTVAVEFTVNRDGTVSNVRIVQSEYRLVGRSYRPGYFKGFLEMNVLPAVQAWRYAPISEPCTSHFKFSWRAEESSGAR